MIKIAPSILSADFAELKKQLQFVFDGHADLIHIDIMDGQFVPNLTFGPKIVETVKKLSPLPLDVHLMVEEPDHLIPEFINAGADIVSVHIEAIKHINRTISFIKNSGVQAGVALNPGTSASSLDAIISEVDMVLVMTVNPGFGGQTFIPSTLEKIKQISNMIQSTGKNIDIEVDGGISKDNSGLVVNAGANILVAGNAVFKADGIKLAINEIKQAS